MVMKSDELGGVTWIIHVFLVYSGYQNIHLDSYLFSVFWICIIYII